MLLVVQNAAEFCIFILGLFLGYMWIMVFCFFSPHFLRLAVQSLQVTLLVLTWGELPGQSTLFPTQAPRGQIPLETATQVMMGHATHRTVALGRSLWWEQGAMCLEMTLPAYDLSDKPSASRAVPPWKQEQKSSVLWADGGAVLCKHSQGLLQRFLWWDTTPPRTSLLETSQASPKNQGKIFSSWVTFCHVITSERTMAIWLFKHNHPLH